MLQSSYQMHVNGRFQQEPATIFESVQQRAKELNVTAKIVKQNRTEITFQFEGEIENLNPILQEFEEKLLDSKRTFTSPQIELAAVKN
jgi:hypothetical protein